MSRESDKILH